MACLTPEERELLQQRLTEAEAALHRLNMGLMARVVVDQNGERVEFAAGNKANLITYIMQLKAQLETPCGTGNPYPTQFGPAGFIF